MMRTHEVFTQKRTRLARPVANGAPAFVLTVLDGPDAGLVVTVDASGPTRLLVGQSPVCSIRLTDREVSRRHAAVGLAGASLVLVDFGSTNGTTVNGVMIKEASLFGGEVIRVGSTVLAVRRGEARACDLGRERSFGRVVGESAAMRRLYPALAMLAENDGAVLVEGEAGTGKELVAEEIHRASRRAEGPFVTLESSSLATDEIAARLFGDGGLFAQARGGVIFIDEAGNLPREVQSMLRERLAAPCDVRVIAASRRNLDRDVQDGRFDEELFFHLAGGRIELPSLRERDGDVAVLAAHFWSELGKGELPSDFLPRFEHYPWPGNVRELKSAVMARMTMGELGPTYRTDESRSVGLDLITSVIEADLPFPKAREQVVGEFERRYVERVLARHNGNVTQAARASGVAHRYFQLVKARLKT